MIPYDDLVVALAAWRARQGLPAAQLTGTSPAPPASPGTPTRQTRAAAPPPSAARTAPPSAPPRTAAAPRPQTPAEFNDFFDEGEGAVSALIEDGDGGYDSAGHDFSMPLGGAVETGETTAIGGAPEPPVEFQVPRRGQRTPGR